LLLVAGFAAAGIGAQTGSPALLAVDAVLLIVGFGAVFPVTTGPVLSVLGRSLDHVRVTGALARQQALAAPPPDPRHGRGARRRPRAGQLSSA